MKATNAQYQNFNRRFKVIEMSQKARNLFKAEESCWKSEKLFEGLKVAQNLKSCPKLAEQLMDSHIISCNVGNDCMI